MATTSNSKASVNYYDANYGNFHSELYGEIAAPRLEKTSGKAVGRLPQSKTNIYPRCRWPVERNY